MECPKCKRDVEMLKFTTTGVMCRDCHAAERKGTPPVASSELVVPHDVGHTITPAELLSDWKIKLVEFRASEKVARRDGHALAKWYEGYADALDMCCMRLEASLKNQKLPT